MTDEMPQELRDRLHGLSAGAAELNQLAEMKYDAARQSRLKADDLHARAEGERAFAQILERDGNEYREKAKQLQITQVELIAEWERSRTTIN